MKKASKLKFYFLSLCAFIAALSLLLPWMSYGVGSKTGIDLGGIPNYIIFAFSVLLFFVSYLSYVLEKGEKLLRYFSSFISVTLLCMFLYEIIRIAYQTTIAKSLPVEMFGVVSLATNQIHIGYGLWVGAVAALLASLVSFVALKIN